MQIKGQAKRVNNSGNPGYDEIQAIVTNLKEELSRLVSLEVKATERTRRADECWMHGVIKPALCYLHKSSNKPTTTSERDIYIYSRFRTIQELTKDTPSLSHRLAKRLSRADTLTSALYNTIYDK